MQNATEFHSVGTVDNGCQDPQNSFDLHPVTESLIIDQQYALKLERLLSTPCVYATSLTIMWVLLFTLQR